MRIVCDRPSVLDRSVHCGRRAETERLVPTERPIAIYEYYRPREATARLYVCSSGYARGLRGRSCVSEWTSERASDRANEGARERERERATGRTRGIRERASRYVCYRCGEIVLLLRRMGLEFFFVFLSNSSRWIVSLDGILEKEDYYCAYLFPAKK